MFYFYYSTKLPSLLHLFGAILLAIQQTQKPSQHLGSVWGKLAICPTRRTYVLGVLYHTMSDFVTSLW